MSEGRLVQQVLDDRGLSLEDMDYAKISKVRYPQSIAPGVE